jgi:rare lipoprotein A
MTSWNSISKACAAAAIIAAATVPTSAESVGVASYYGKEFHGRRAANGEIFNMNAMTAAHKSLPFGTRLQVTNMSNGRSVIVRIQDRGPFIRGRDLDLSFGAAKAIGMVHSGTARIKYARI